MKKRLNYRTEKPPLKYRHLGKSVIFALSVLMGGPGLTRAQDSAEGTPAKEEPIEELSVFEVSATAEEGYFSKGTTAGTRSAQEIIDIPGSISVLNEDFLQDLNTFHVDRALRFGVSGVTPNVAQRDDVNIRGFRQQQPFRDGVEVTGFVSVPMYDVARVEVVKGPAAMTFGDAAPLGGVINYVSRKPTEVPKGDIQFVAGAENSFRRTTANISGPVPIKLGEDATVSYRATVGLQHDDRDKAIESDDQQFYGGALRFDFGKTKLNVETYYYKVNGYLYFNDFIDTTAPSPGPIKLNPLSTEDFSPSEGPNNQDIDEFHLSLQAITEINKYNTLKFFYRFRQHNERRRHLRGIKISPEDNFTLERQDIPLEFDFDQNVFQFDYLGSFGGDKIRHEVTSGFQFVTSDNTTRLDVFTASSEGALAINSIDTRNPDFSQDNNRPVPTWATQNQNVSNDNISWYAQDFIHFWRDKLTAIGGVRWIKNNQTTENLNVAVGEAGRLANANAPTKKTFRYGGVFKPIPGFSIYGVHSTTFRINNFDLEFGPEKPPDSEGLLTEIGAKFSGFNFMGGRVFGSLAYFKMSKTNVRQVGVATDNTPAITFDKSNTSKGGEFDFGYSHKLGPGSLQTIITGELVTVKNADGSQPREAPNDVYSFFLSYNFEEGALKGLNIGGGGNFEGDKPTNITPTTGYFIDDANIYTLFANYTYKKHMRFGINVSNLTDNTEIIRAATDGLAMRRRGRSVEFSVGYSW